MKPRGHYIGNVITVCEINDLSNFMDVVTRKAFAEEYNARIWADSFIAKAKLKAMRKYGDDFQEALFGYEARFYSLDFNPGLVPLGRD